VIEAWLPTISGSSGRIRVWRLLYESTCIRFKDPRSSENNYATGPSGRPAGGVSWGEVVLIAQMSGISSLSGGRNKRRLPPVLSVNIGAYLDYTPGTGGTSSGDARTTLKGGTELPLPSSGSGPGRSSH
jgi:hypothetical protein